MYTGVNVDERKLSRLISIFRLAQKQIMEEIEGATHFGVTNRRAILAQTNKILDDLADEIGREVLAKEIPNQYKAGANAAVKQLNNAGADIRITTQFNLVHRQAIEALVDDTARSFAESMTGIKRSTQLLISRATREAITIKLAKGTIAGEDLQTIKRQIVGLMREQGLASLIDKGGKRWTLDRYAEMLIRTKAVEARNKGMINRLVENGYDLLQVSSHNTDHDACAVWEGKILSATGATPGYPTLADAEAGGLFHPNAVLEGTTFISYGELNEMVGADYEGPAIVFTTSQGHTLTIGPNHPILTQRGLVKAKDITKVDKLVYDSRIISPTSVINPDFKQVPMVEDVFSSILFFPGSVSKVATTRHDLHGDRVFCKGEIKVVEPARGLLSVLDSGGIEEFRNSGFVWSDMQIVFKSGVSSSGLSTMGSSHVGFGTPMSSDSSSMHLTQLPIPGGFGAGLNTTYFLAHINEIQEISFKGKAFDAETQSGLYNSNGFVVSNCKHAVNVIVPSLAKQTGAYLDNAFL